MPTGHGVRGQDITPLPGRPPWAPHGFTRPAVSCFWSVPSVHGQDGHLRRRRGGRRSSLRAGSLSAPAGVPEIAGCRVSVFSGASVQAFCTQVNQRAASDCCALRVRVFSVLSWVDLSGLSPALNQASPRCSVPGPLWGTPCIYCMPVYVV